MDFVLKRNVVRRIRSRTLFELNKYDITISKMYGLLTIKFIPASTLDLLHYMAIALMHVQIKETIRVDSNDYRGDIVDSLP